MGLIHEELSQKIIGAAMTVHNALRPGLDEKIYERSLVIELEGLGLRINQQKEFLVFYKSQQVGKLIPDLIVEDKVIVDTKVVESFVERHLAQVLGYLAITDLHLALLLNFKHDRLQWKRIVR